MDATTGEKKILVSEAKLKSLAPPVEKIKDEREKERVTRYHVAAYVWSPDSKHLLFDSLGQLWLYSLETATAVQVTSSSDPSSDPKFSPDSSRIAYLRGTTSICGQLPAEKKNSLPAATRTTGKKPTTPEWRSRLGLCRGTYGRSNYFWSPDGKDILFLQMDETKVPTYPITN